MNAKQALELAASTNNKRVADALERAHKAIEGQATRGGLVVSVDGYFLPPVLDALRKEGYTVKPFLDPRGEGGITISWAQSQ